MQEDKGKLIEFLLEMAAGVSGHLHHSDQTRHSLSSTTRTRHNPSSTTRVNFNHGLQDDEGESEEQPSSLVDNGVEEGPSLLDLNGDGGQKPSQWSPACETGGSAHSMSAGSPTKGGQMSPTGQGLDGEDVFDEDRVEVDADEAVQHASDDAETEVPIAGATARPLRSRSIEDTSDAGATSSAEATISEVTDGVDMMC